MATPTVTIEAMPPALGTALNPEKGPLSALSTTAKNGLSSLVYPSDLGSTQKNHWVTFTIKDIQPTTLGPAKENTLNGANISLNNPGATTALVTSAAAAYVAVNAAVGAAAAAIATAGVGTTAGALYGAASAAPGAASVAVGGIIAGSILAKGGIAVQPQVINTKQVISLYMPDTLTQDYNSLYDEMSLTTDLGSAITTLRAIDSGVGDFLKQGVSLGNALSGSPAVSQAVAGLLETAGRDIPGVNVQNLAALLQNAQGYALNPQLQMIYRGTGLRSFSLTFIFTPKSKDEASMVNNIIESFRFYSAPSLATNTGGVSTSSMFLIPPSVFQIQFFVNGVESNVLSKYGDCVLTSMDINYAPNGFAAYEDRSMVQTQLTLSFKETDILTRDKIDSGARR